MFAVFGQFFNSAIFLWEVCIAVNLFRMIVLRIIPDYKDLLLSHWFVWWFSVFFTALPLTTNDLGPPACWIKDTPSGRVWRFVALYGPLLAYMTIILILY